MATTPDHATFRRFSDLDEARAFAEELNVLGFHAAYESDTPVQDPLFVGNGMTWHLVKLPNKEFEPAERALLDRAVQERVDIPADHYLHQFNDQELMEILLKPDEWSAEDAVMAQTLLRQRGKPVSPDAIEVIRASRAEQLREKDPSPRGYIIAGYVFAFIGGLIGLVIGWHINTSKRTLPNGERVPVYASQDRKHGARIFIIGVVAFVIWSGLRLWSWLA